MPKDLNIDEFYASYAKNIQNCKAYMGSADVNTYTAEYIIEHNPPVPGLFDNMYEFNESMFTEEDNIMLIKHERYTPLCYHSHTFFEMVYVISGNCDNYVGEIKTHLTEGDFCILAPGIVHTLAVFNDSNVINFLIRTSTFMETFLDTLSEKSVLSDFFWGALFKKNGNPYTVCHSSDDPGIYNTIEMLIYASLSGTDCYTRKIKENLIRIIFAYMIRNHSKDFAFSPVYSKNSEVFQKILYTIQKEFATVTLSELAAQFHYTTPYLSKLIKSEAGMGFTQIVSNIRIRNACILLKNTDLTIREVYQRSGFNKSDVFYKMFKKYMGISPKEYRQNAGA